MMQRKKKSEKPTDEQMLRRFIAGQITFSQLDEHNTWITYFLEYPSESDIPGPKLIRQIWRKHGPAALRGYKQDDLPAHLALLVENYGWPTQENTR